MSKSLIVKTILGQIAIQSFAIWAVEKQLIPFYEYAIFCSMWLAIWMGVAVAFTRLHAEANADMVTLQQAYRAMGGLPVKRGGDQAMCGWCAFTGHPVDVLMHETIDHQG